MQSQAKLIEWHCGIGGVSAAVSGRFQTLAAIDIKREAIEIYSTNFHGYQTVIKNIDTISDHLVKSWGNADLWWMSPPCQPHTVLGRKRDVADNRSASFLRMLQLLEKFRPPCIAMENVPGFGQSQSRQLLIQTLEKAGYSFIEETICPTSWGWPNRRNRYYLAACRDQLTPLREPDLSLQSKCNLVDVIDPLADRSQELYVNQEFLDRYKDAVHLADRDHSAEITNCFTSAYGRSPTRCGSYLIVPNDDCKAVRRFSPREVLSLLDFPQEYSLPADFPPSKLWPMVGNSLALGATRRVLSRLPVW